MNLNVFDVVELTDGRKATILNIDKNKYKVEIMSKNFLYSSIEKISVKQIKNIIYKKS